MISKEFIKTQIIGMGTDKFDQLVAFILKKCFDYNPCPVNGKGDGGSDFRLFGQHKYVLFQDIKSQPVMSVQVTIQEQNWQKKAMEDAQKAKEHIPNLSGYLFITSRSREQADLLLLQDKISQEVGIRATCLGCNELTGLISSNHLFHEFAAISGLVIPEKIIGRPDSRLKMLHRLFAMNSNRTGARTEIYDTIIVSQLSAQEAGLSRETLIERVRQFLELPEIYAPSINSQIDSLLTKKIQQVNGILLLTEDTERDVVLANSAFDADIKYLAAEISKIVDNNGGHIINSSTEKLAVLIAESYVNNQFKKLNRLAMTSLLRLPSEKFDLIAELRKKMHEYSVTNVEKAMSEILDLASSNMLMKKLVNATIYAFMEHQSNPCAVLMLGEYDWQNVHVILDASVAIPYLVTSLYGNSGDRFSEVFSSALAILKENHANLVVTYDYINECSSHLVDALLYVDLIDKFPQELQNSTNRYVAHYCQMLLRQDSEIPGSLTEYIENISSEAVKSITDKKEKIKRVMSEIQPLLAQYGVNFEEIPRYDAEAYRKDLEVDYTYQLESKGKRRPLHLINHDLNTLAHIRRNYSEKNQTTIFLTWDTILLELSKKVANSGVVLSPAEAVDLFQLSQPISDNKLCDIAIEFASTNSHPTFSAIALLDYLIENAEKLEIKDWKSTMLSRNLLSDWLTDVGRLSKTMKYAKESEVFEAMLREKGLLPSNTDAADSE